MPQGANSFGLNPEIIPILLYPLATALTPSATRYGNGRDFSFEAREKPTNNSPSTEERQLSR